jgi:hypothetical protein
VYEVMAGKAALQHKENFVLYKFTVIAFCRNPPYRLLDLSSLGKEAA